MVEDGVIVGLGFCGFPSRFFIQFINTDTLAYTPYVSGSAQP